MFCLYSSQPHAQIKKERIGKSYFTTYAYSEAIDVYERLVAKGIKKEEVFKNLADAYYFNGKFSDAVVWYGELFEGDYTDKDLSKIDKEYYYRYSQSLKSIGDLEKAKNILSDFIQLAPEDYRVVNYVKNTAYLEEINNRPVEYSLENIAINTSFSDYGGVLDNGYFIFTSARDSAEKTKEVHTWTNEHYTSLYSSELGPEGSLGEVALLDTSLHSFGNEATAIFSKDGNTMYFTANNSVLKNGKKKQNENSDTLLKIYKTDKDKDGKWGQAVELSINSDDFNTAHPALSVDEQWLYFSSDREGSKGASDLYRVKIGEDGRLGLPINLGDKVNTSGREAFPFISSDNILYFSSDGHPGLGGLDVFYVELDEDIIQRDVKNIGRPINSGNDDFSFYWSAERGNGFVSSNREGGKGGDDIYQVTLAPCFQTLSGVVYELETNKVLSNAALEIISHDPIEHMIVNTDSIGRYATKEFKCDLEFKIKASHSGYNTVELSFNTGAIAGEKILNIGLSRFTEPLKVNDDLFKKLAMNMIYFNFDKSDIRSDAAKELEKILQIMQLYPAMKIDVRSHTDSRGNDNYNRGLSDRRVRSTIAWLIEKGISADRLTGRGYGESMLVNRCANNIPCSTEEHQENRRSEFIITSM